MAITCPRCGAGFDATLFEFGHRVRCGCGAEVCYPGEDLRGGHTSSDLPPGTRAASPSCRPGAAGSRRSDGDGDARQPG